MYHIQEPDVMSKSIRVITTMTEADVNRLNNDIMYLAADRISNRITERVMEKITPILDKVVAEIKV